MKKIVKNNNQTWLFGKFPVLAALKNKKREIFEILVTKNSEDFLKKFLINNNLSQYSSKVKITDNQKLEKLFENEQNHQGVALKCSKLKVKNHFDLLEELHSLQSENLPNLLILDQISDPHNFGAIIRSANAFGIKKIIYPSNNSAKENSVISKTSAGTIENVELFEIANISNLLEKLKKIGYWAFGLAGEGKENISKIREFNNIVLIIGSEGKGIRDLVKKNCDFLVKIDMNEDVESLNASVASAIALYEISRK